MTEIRPVKPPVTPPAPPIPPKASEKEIKARIPPPEIPPEEILARRDAEATQAISVWLAKLAAEAKKRELTFEEIIYKVIYETGITDPEAAMGEANRRLQKEIEDTLEDIKANKELMEEAEAWEDFSRVLVTKLSEDQVREILKMLYGAVVTEY